MAEETDESLFWLELLVEADIMPKDKLGNLMTEVSELLAVFSTARKNTPNDKRK